MSEKIQPQHLSRKAMLYVRQSSAFQVSHNLESGRLQYAMQTRLRDLGFAEIEIVDEDLGRSAAGTVARSGFERIGHAIRANLQLPSASRHHGAARTGSAILAGRYVVGAAQRSSRCTTLAPMAMWHATPVTAHGSIRASLAASASAVRGSMWR